MTYVKQTWMDEPDETTPITAARLDHIEDGIYNASLPGGLSVVGSPQTASFAVTPADDVMLVDCSTADVVATLPTAVGLTGKRFTFVKTNSWNLSFAVAIIGTGGETISGSTWYTLHGKGDVLEVVSDGANWLQIGGNTGGQEVRKEWFVADGHNGVGGSGTNAFGSFAAALAAASNGDTIYICTDITEALTISKSVRVVGLGTGATIVNAPGSILNNINGILCHVTADSVTIENIRFFSADATWKGIMLALDAVSFFRGVNITTAFTGTNSSYPTSNGAGTGVGGIGILQHRGEGCYYEQINLNGHSIGFAVGNEASTNVVVRAVASGCVQELVMGLDTGSIVQPIQPGPFPYGGGNGGGWEFSGFKSVAPHAVTGTPVVDLIGDGTAGYGGSNNGANTFINADWSEGAGFGAIVCRVGSAGNTFIRPVSSPQAVWLIDGSANTFLGARILGPGWILDGDKNIVVGGFSNGALSGAGDGSLFRSVSFVNGPDLAFALTGANNSFESCTYGSTGGPADPTLSDLGTTPRFVAGQGLKTIPYTASMTADVQFCDYFTVVATDGTAFTVENPVDSSNATTANIMSTKRITYDIKNSSGGALGTVTWGNKFLLAGAFTNPGNTKRRTITFFFDGTNWVETNRAAADI